MKLLGSAAVSNKGPGDWVTEADFQSQAVIREYLIGQFPDHDFLGEEAVDESSSAAAPDAEFCWIVDPLDGTANYIHQLRSFSVSIGLQYRRSENHHELIVGTVFDPSTDECFSAALGRGATLNGNAIQTSSAEKIDASLIVFSMTSRVQPTDPQIARLLNVLATTSTVRRLGSAALNLCYVGCGRVDAYWATNLNAWDIAAGWLIARESGAVIEDFSGEPLSLDQPKFCCAATRELWNVMQPLLDVNH